MSNRVKDFMSEFKLIQDKYNVYLSPEVNYCWDCDDELGVDIPELELYLSLRDLEDHKELTRITEDEIPLGE